MLQLLRSLFKKPKPKKILEVIESDDKAQKREIHHFNSFNEETYCSILGYENSSQGQGFQTLRIAWRNRNRIKVGDLIILSSKDVHKTLRLVSILKENGDVKIGIANMLK
jgi:hypothetical protein